MPPARVAFPAKTVPLLLVLVSVLGAGCVARARPPELIALEKLRADRTFSDSDRRAFDLLAAADDLMVRAEAAWDHGNLHDARFNAIMGLIKMKTARAILEREREEARIADLDADLAIAQDESARLDEQLAGAEEEVAVLERMRTTSSAAATERKTFLAQLEATKKQAEGVRQQLADQLANEKRRAEALDGLRSAELAVHTADTVDMARYAKPKYAAATSMLQDAHKAFDAGKWDDVLERTGLCRAEVEAGIAIARPQYESAEAALAARARDRALEADATALVGVRTRLERDGDLQRLVLVLRGLFAGNKAVPLPERAKVLDDVEGLLAKYPSYAIQLTGFTDDQGKAADLAALSLARANAVYWTLVSRGVDPKRLSVDGKGGADPVADNATPDGRAANARVELAILYHIAIAP